jgi:hypothetical protein
MKKPILILLLGMVILGNISCKKALESLFSGFDMKAPDIQVTIPAIPIVPSNEIEIGSFTSRFNLDSAIKANTGNVFSINSVSSMTIKEMKVTVTNGTSANNLSNFESGRLLIASNANTNFSELANFQFPTVETYTYTANTENSPELIGYYRGTEITYKLYGKLRKPTTISLNLTISSTITVR